MKKINKNIKYLFIAGAMTVMASCTESNTGFLDPDTSGGLTQEKVFADSLYTYEFQTKIYLALQRTYFADNAVGQGGYWSWSDMSDDSKNIWSGSAQIAHRYNMNSINSANEGRFKNHWNNCYNAISYSNILLANIDKGPLSPGTKVQFKAETRAIRAWLYFHLLRLYGGTSLLGDKVFDLTAKIEEPRATFAEQVAYINSELDAVSKILPATQVGRDYGRITSGAALAMKARVLMFAASPLSNGSVPTTDPMLIPLLGNATEDKGLWKQAADAAKAVIDLGRYELYEDNTTAPGYGFYQMQTTRVSTEAIFMLMKNNDRFSEQYLLPQSRGGTPQSGPFQGISDAFVMKNGKNISDPTSGYNVNKPYVNRDPRMDYTLLHDGSMWIPKSGGNKTRINYYKKGNDVPTGSSPKTGVTWRKFCNENVSGSGSNEVCFPFIRLAEMYLNYAEAMNEYDPSGSKTLIEQAVIKIRKRAGIDAGADNRYGIPATYTQAEMRELIHNERRCEFAFEEGHRYFDLKRWKELELRKKDKDFFYIVWSEPVAGQDQTFELIKLETHKFDPNRQYYFPIPNSEIAIVGADLLIQNPGW